MGLFLRRYLRVSNRRLSDLVSLIGRWTGLAWRWRHRASLWADGSAAWLRVPCWATVHRANRGPLSSVEFCSRWYLYARKSPFALHLVSHKLLRLFFNFFFKQFSSDVGLTDDGPFSSFRERSSSISLFLHLCPSADLWFGPWLTAA